MAILKNEGRSGLLLLGGWSRFCSGILLLIFFLGGSRDVGGACQLAGFTVRWTGRELLNRCFTWRRGYSVGTSST